MKNFVRTIILTVVCLSASSIFAQEQTQPAPNQTTTVAENVETKAAVPGNTEEKATIYFYRIKQFTGSALEPSVYVNDQPVARMDNGRYFGVTLAPGKHTFSMGDKQTGFEIDMKPGQTYYAKVTIEAGMWKGHGRLTLLMPEQGAFEIKKTKALGVTKIKDRALVTIYEGNDKVDSEQETKENN